MQSHPQDRIDLKPEPSPMAIVGAILAQAVIILALDLLAEARSADYLSAVQNISI